MNNYLQFFTNSINQLKAENRYREFVNISRIKGDFPYAINNQNGRKIILWCSNDYLSMGQNDAAIDKAIEALKSYGLGSGGTRNISGTNDLVIEDRKSVV